MCDEGADRVELLDAAGTSLCALAEGLVEQPVAVALDPLGRAVVAQRDGRVKVFTYLTPS